MPPKAGPASNATAKAMACPLVYGSVAWWLGRKADESATHRWTVYVRGPQGEDISYFIDKVVFHLHPSFDKSAREVCEPPYVTAPLLLLLLRPAAAATAAAAATTHYHYGYYYLLLTNSPPLSRYEVTEQGWGEFEVLVRLFFKDSTQKPVDVVHVIKL